MVRHAPARGGRAAPGLKVAIPLIYNVNSVRERWASAVVAVLGIGGTVAVFVAMLAMARGFRATLVSSGSPSNAIVRRAGATSEMDSSLPVEQVRVLEAARGVARSGANALISPEVVVVAAFPLKSTGTDANVQLRGVSPRVLEVRPGVKVTGGRFFRPALPELVIGRNVTTTYAGFGLGRTLPFGGEAWTVVGTFDAGGSAFDSEVWCDSEVLKRVYQRPLGVFQSATVRLESPEAFPAFKASLAADPRLSLQVEREIDYYEKESLMLTQLITVLGSMVARSTRCTRPGPSGPGRSRRCGRWASAPPASWPPSSSSPSSSPSREASWVAPPSCR
jgi:putative ABC transport system permease protein